MNHYGLWAMAHLGWVFVKKTQNVYVNRRLSTSSELLWFVNEEPTKYYIRCSEWIFNNSQWIERWTDTHTRMNSFFLLYFAIAIYFDCIFNNVRFYTVNSKWFSGIFTQCIRLLSNTNNGYRSKRKWFWIDNKIEFFFSALSLQFSVKHANSKLIQFTVNFNCWISNAKINNVNKLHRIWQIEITHR